MLKGLIRFGAGGGASAGDVIARVVPFWKQARPLPHEHDFRAFAQDGYRRNVVIYACVNEIAGGLARTGLQVVREDGTEVAPAHPLSRLLKRPNPEESRRSFLERLVTFLEVAGNVYVWKRRGALKTPAELYLLRPDRVKVIPGADGMVQGYEHTVEGMQPRTVPAEEVLHSKLHDPLDDYYGLSPIAVCARAGDLDNESMDYLRAFFLNGASPAGLLKFKNRVSEGEKHRVRQAWRDLYGTEKGWHDLAVIDADVDYQELGSRPEKLRMDSIFDATETRICAAFGVPPIVIAVRIGLLRSTMANYREAVKSLWQETLIPIYDRIADDLTLGVARAFDLGLQIRFDYSRVEVLQEAQQERRQFALQAWEKGLAKLDEARDMAGLPALGGPEGEERKGTLGGVASPNIIDVTPEPKRLPPAEEGDEDEPEDVDDDEPRRRRGKAALPKASAPSEGHANSKTPLWKAVHRVVEGYEGQLQSLVLKAFAQTREKLNRTALATAIDARDVDAAIAASAWDDVGLKLLWDGLPEVLRDTVEDSGNLALKYLARDIVDEAKRVRRERSGTGAPLEAHASLTDAAVKARTLRFDVVDPRAVDYIRGRSGELVQGIDDETRSTIRGLIERSFTEGIPPRQLGRLIEQYIGLTERDQGFLDRLQRRMAERGDSQADIDDKTARESRRLLRLRGETIARTEIIGAAMQGQQVGWLQAVDEGLVNAAKAQREWIVTLDDRLCPICEPLDGKLVRLDESFGPASLPPAHPMCRCAVVLWPFGKKTQAN